MKRFIILLAIISLFNIEDSFAEDITKNFNKFEKKIYKTLEKQYEYNQLGILNLFGYRYSKGIEGFPKDYDRSLYWFKEASSYGYPLSTFNLGVAYFNGDLELDRNFQKAHELLILAFEQRFIDENSLFYASLDELKNGFKTDLGDPKGDFENLKTLFLDALVLPSNTRYNRLKNLTKKNTAKSFDEILEEFKKTEQIVCSGDEIFKLKIVAQIGEFIVLKKISEFNMDEFLDQNDLLLELQYAKQKDDQIEWFHYIDEKGFGLDLNYFTHYKLFTNKNKQFKLHEQPYFIKSKKEFNLKMNQKFKYKSYELFENPGSQKHMELEEDFYQELKNNYQSIVKDTNNGASLTREYLCEV